MRAATVESGDNGIMFYKFQSTQPMRAATKIAFNKVLPNHISIHAAHEGCDSVINYNELINKDFNPRSP